MKKPILTEYDKWISIDEIEVLNHGLNWSNWIDTYPCKGKWEIKLSDHNIPNREIKIFMPASEWDQKDNYGFWKVYSGRIEFTKTELLIWQNEKTPVRINYIETESEIELTIFNRPIKFKKNMQYNNL